MLNTDHLYARIADQIEKMILEGVYQLGDKLPSVRSMSAERGISPSSVFQAYYQLEAKGLIEARPRSGYYIRYSPRQSAALPRMARPSETGQFVSVEDMISEVYSDLADHHLVRFSLAAPALELLPAARLNKAMIQALRTHPFHGISYEDIHGNRSLRKQLARLALSWNGAFSEEEVLVTAGCMEALVMCLKAVTQPGDLVAIESPTYFGIFQVIERLGLRAIAVPADPATGPDLRALEWILDTQQVRACLFVPNFNNPLGSRMPDSHKERLVRLLTERNIPLIEDDIYGDLYFGKKRPLTCKTFDRDGIVLYCSSLSKSLAPGYRIGWTIPGRYYEQVSSLKMMHNVTGTTLTQQAVAIFLENGRYEHHLRKFRRVLHTHCLRYTQEILAHFPPGIRISRPDGGYVLWIELPSCINAFSLYREAMRYHISIAPGQIFSADGKYTHYIRLGFGQPLTRSVINSLDQLSKLIRKQMQEAGG